ncbi:hypothetical protein [Clostridium perfringens]|jgi:hypothetical protein|uniref:hypothetical protein n=1 Tax=Clostridium perfringens TaxID=1502 RepID=UPI0018E4D4FD|nr:hypothetical protein [Clostridium perfringens]MBI6040258.1 hypothetical protein [Clostridium perfringens]
MKYEEVKKIIDGAIESCYYYEIQHEFNKMNECELKEVDKQDRAIDTLINSFKENLSEKELEKVYELINLLASKAELENEYYFRRGASVAFNNLKFLKGFESYF